MIQSLSPPLTTAAACNRDCARPTTDRAALHGIFAAIDGELAALTAARPNLFADSAVFVSSAETAAMARIIAAVEGVVALTPYRDAMLAGAPEAARKEGAARGVFISYDFHLGPEGPRLIEINTNAGGCLLAAALARAQRPFCTEINPAPGLDGLETTLIGMFEREWRLERGDMPLRTVAIADDAPETQFLFSEFLMFRDLFRRRGFEVEIVDARALDWHSGQLWNGATPVDLVYNRSCDFYLEKPEHAALAAAWRSGGVVMTPHPRAHALYADKRALILLSDDARLAAWNVPAADRATLAAGVPATVAVSPERAEALWAARARLFFKPATGYGSRAAYRGDKLTRRVWQEILTGRYVAQALALPGERRAPSGGAAMKADVRNFVYDGHVQFLSARLYRGQTTNFQTSGGGLAAVFLMEGVPAAQE